MSLLTDVAGISSTDLLCFYQSRNFRAFYPFVMVCQVEYKPDELRVKAKIIRRSGGNVLI